MSPVPVHFSSKLMWLHSLYLLSVGIIGLPPQVQQFSASPSLCFFPSISPLAPWENVTFRRCGRHPSHWIQCRAKFVGSSESKPQSQRLAMVFTMFNIVIEQRHFMKSAVIYVNEPEDTGVLRASWSSIIMLPPTAYSWTWTHKSNVPMCEGYCLHSLLLINKHHLGFSEELGLFLPLPLTYMILNSFVPG